MSIDNDISFARLTHREAMLSAPLGLTPGIRLPPAEVKPREVLERVMGRAVSSEPCYVLFSGGRDSSAVLAVAVHVARKLNVPDPIPVTAIYPGDPDAMESEWQDLVMRHLNLNHRLIVSVTDERRMLGAVSRANLVRRGLVWPEGVQSQPVLFESLAQGTLLTGEGGDGFIAARRITPLLLLRQSRTRPSRNLLRGALQAIEPDWMSRARQRHAWDSAPLPGWLRPRALDVLFKATAGYRGPLRWDTATHALFASRHIQVGLHNLSAGAAEFGLNMIHPLADADFVAALAQEGGRWGFRGRTHLFRHLFADLLPDAVLSRKTKAFFNASRWGDDERDFANGWDGSGMDESLIDPAALRAEWLKDRPMPPAMFLAHVAWLHQAGLSQEGALL